MGKNTSTSLGNHFEKFIKALEIGEQSGFVENFDPKQNLKELHREYL